jgi:single-strand DNA-binding protein
MSRWKAKTDQFNHRFGPILNQSNNIMPNLNKVMLMGNITRDPEVKYTPKGSAIASFGIAINRKFTPEGGEAREEVTFVDITAFGKQAETVGEYLKKGKPVFIEGRLKLDQWDDKQTGQKRSKMTVVMEGFQFLGSRGGKDDDRAPGPDRPTGQPAGRSTRPPPASAPRPPADPDLDAEPSDIPF